MGHPARLILPAMVMRPVKFVEWDMFWLQVHVLPVILETLIAFNAVSTMLSFVISAKWDSISKSISQDQLHVLLVILHAKCVHQQLCVLPALSDTLSQSDHLKDPALLAHLHALPVLGQQITAFHVFLVTQLGDGNASQTPTLPSQ